MKIENDIDNEADEVMETGNDLPTDVEMEEPIQSIVEVDVATDLLVDEEKIEVKTSVEDMKIIETPSTDLENVSPESLSAHSEVEKSASKNESIVEKSIPVHLEVETSTSNTESTGVKSLHNHLEVEKSASENESISHIKTMSTESNVEKSASKNESVDKRQTMSIHSVAEKSEFENESVDETKTMLTQPEKPASTNESISEKETIPTLSEVEKKEILPTHSVVDNSTTTNEKVGEKQTISTYLEGEISASKSESADETKAVPTESEVGKSASNNESVVKKSLCPHLEVEKSTSQNESVGEKGTLPNHSEVKESDSLETKITDVEVVKVNKTMTQEELNNMSLMTEDGSLLEDNSVSLKYSDDECEGEQTISPEHTNNNAGAIMIDTQSVAENVESAAVNNDNTNNNLEDKTTVDMVIEDAVQHSTPTKDDKDKTIKLDETVVEDKMLVDPIISEQKTSVSTPQRKQPIRRSSVSSLQSIDKLSELAEDLDTSIAMSTRSASKRKSSKKDPDEDALSVVSNASSRKSLTLRSDSKLDTSFCSDLPADGGEQSAPLRKSRRSILAFAKPNLSIIPEISNIESEKSHLDKTDSSRGKDLTATQSSILEYSASRR